MDNNSENNKKTAPEANLGQIPNNSDNFQAIARKMTYCVEIKKEEQERTRIKKKLFLNYWSKSRGVISATCRKTDIHPDTFYDWKKNDPEFAQKLEEVTKHRNEDVEDILMGKIFIEQDGACVRYYLERRDPNYKPKNTTEVIAGDRTLEDLIWEAEEKGLDLEKLKKQKNEAQNREQNVDREPAQNKEQEGNKSSVQTKPGSKLLLEQEDKEKPAIESEAERTE